MDGVTEFQSKFVNAVASAAGLAAAEAAAGDATTAGAVGGAAAGATIRAVGAATCSGAFLQAARLPANPKILCLTLVSLMQTL